MEIARDIATACHNDSVSLSQHCSRELHEYLTITLASLYTIELSQCISHAIKKFSCVTEKQTKREMDTHLCGPAWADPENYVRSVQSSTYLYTAHADPVVGTGDPDPHPPEKITKI